MRGTIFFDGGSRGNPGPAACAFVILDAGGDVLDRKGVFLGTRTNNQAEYMGLILGMERALENGLQEAVIKGDSELVIRQMAGEYKVRSAGLKPLHRRARKLQERFRSLSFLHVRRELNTDADALLNMALDLQTDV